MESFQFVSSRRQRRQLPSCLISWERCWLLRDNLRLLILCLLSVKCTAGCSEKGSSHANMPNVAMYLFRVMMTPTKCAPADSNFVWWLRWLVPYNTSPMLDCCEDDSCEKASCVPGEGSPRRNWWIKCAVMDNARPCYDRQNSCPIKNLVVDADWVRFGLVSERQDFHTKFDKCAIRSKRGASCSLFQWSIWPILPLDSHWMTRQNYQTKFTSKATSQ